MDLALAALGVLLVAWVLSDVWSSAGAAFIGAAATAAVGAAVAWIRRASRLSQDERVRQAAEKACELITPKLDTIDTRLAELTAEVYELREMLHVTQIEGTRPAQQAAEVLVELRDRLAGLEGLVRGIMRPDIDRPRRPPDPLTPGDTHEH